MKRIIAVILTLILALSMPGIAADSAEFTDTYVRSDNFDSMAGLLQYLEILDVQSYDGPASRAKFTQMLCYAAGLKDFVLELPEQVFSDVPPEIYYAGELTLAKEHGYISGYEDGTFRPDETITLRDAMVCLINVLGYRELAMAYGGYPNGYYTVMNNIDLKKGISVSYNEPISMACAIHLLYNALHTDVFQILGIEGDANKYGTIDGEDLLDTSFQIRRESGIINSVDVSSLSGDSGLPAYYIYIGEKNLFAGDIEVRSLLGSYVTAYYTERDGTETVCYLAVDASQSSDTVLQVFDIAEIADGKITVENEEGKDIRYSYDNRGPVIFNGVSTGSALSMELLSDENGLLMDGTVTLRDNDGDGKADLVIVDVYEDMLVGQIDRSNNTVHDYYNYDKSFEIPADNEEGRVKLYAADGSELTINDLNSKDSLQVYRSKDEAGQPYIRVYVSTVSVAGTIDAIYTEGHETRVEIEGINYTLSNYLMDRTPVPALGRSVKLTLNYSGRVVELSNDASAGIQWGMLIAVERDTGLEEGLRIQMVGTEGTVQVLRVASKITLDSVRYQDMTDEVLTKLNNAASTVKEQRPGQCLQVVKYRTNSEGELNYIDTVLDSNGNPTTIDTIENENQVYFGVIDPNNPNAIYESGTGVIDKKILLGDSATVFTYPNEEDPDNMEKYTMQDKSYFVNDGRYPGLIYFMDSDEKLSVNVFLNEYEKNIGKDVYSLYYSLVEKTSTVVDDDGEQMTKLYMYRNGNAETVIGENTLLSTGDEPTLLSNVKPGDLIYYTSDSLTQEMSDFQMRYICASGTLCNNDVSKAGNNSHGLLSAYIYRRTQDGIQYVPTDNPALIQTEFENGNYYTFKASGVPIVLYDTQRAGSVSAKSGSYLDLADYVSAKENCSKVLVHIQHSLYQRVFEVFLYY